MSITRKRYFIRLYGRIAVFILCLIMCTNPQNYNILEGMNFFDKFHILHILWFIWVFDMILQIIPIKNGDVHIVGYAKKQSASGTYDLFTINDTKYNPPYTVMGTFSSLNNSTDNTKVTYIRVSSGKGTMWTNNSISGDIYFNFKYPLI